MTKKDAIFRTIIFLVVLAGTVVAARRSSSPPPTNVRAPVPVQHYADVMVDTFLPAADNIYTIQWGREVRARFAGKPAVAVFVEGANIPEHWLVDVGPLLVPVELLIQAEEKKYPGRLVVLLSCNENHIILHGYPGVWYSTDRVWLRPHQEKGAVGDIGEFIEAR